MESGFVDMLCDKISPCCRQTFPTLYLERQTELWMWKKVIKSWNRNGSGTPTVLWKGAHFNDWKRTNFLKDKLFLQNLGYKPKKSFLRMANWLETEYPFRWNYCNRGALLSNHFGISWKLARMVILWEKRQIVTEFLRKLTPNLRKEHGEFSFVPF